MSGLVNAVNSALKSGVGRSLLLIGGMGISYLISGCGGSTNPVATSIPIPTNTRPPITATFTPSPTAQRLVPSTPKPTEQPYDPLAPESNYSTNQENIPESIETLLPPTPSIPPTPGNLPTEPPTPTPLPTETPFPTATPIKLPTPTSEPPPTLTYTSPPTPTNTPPPTNTPVPTVTPEPTIAPTKVRHNPTATPKPTPLIDNAPTYTQEQYDNFKNTVGYSITKFEEGIPVHIEFYGSASKSIMPTRESIKTFEEGAASLEEATNHNLRFKYTKPPADADARVLEVYLDVPHSDLKTIFPNYSQALLERGLGAWDWLELTPDGYIQKAKMVVSTKTPDWTTPYPRELLDFFILHELMNVTGAHVDQIHGPINNIINDRRRLPHEYPRIYSNSDIITMGMLYDSSVEPGMNPHQGEPLFNIAR